MVDFRKALLLSALLVTATGIASAQTAFSCAANTAQPPIVRYEGLAEEVGQVELVCTGGTPAAIGAQVNKVNVQVFLGTNVTSRLLSSSTLGSEALLLVDDPPVGDREVCVSPGNCNLTSAAGNGNSDTYRNERVNVFQGTMSAPNSITWFGVPLDPPGTNTRKVRIVNVRANANQAGLSGSLIPNDIKMVITISGTGGPSVSNPVQTVAYVLPGMTFSSRGAKSFNQCEPQTGEDAFIVSYKENFGTAFRANLINNGASGDEQNVIGNIYNTEAMFVDNQVNAVIGAAGRATQGTRLWASFANVPTGVALSVDDQNIAYVAGTLPLATTNGHAAQLVTGALADGSGGTVSATSGTTTILTDAATTRSATAVWEVISAQPGVTEAFEFNVYVTYDSTPLPGLGTATVTGNYAPISTVTTYSSTAPAPRFVLQAPDPANGFTINPCQTNLLFPFIASDGKFDTGIAISNTSKDPYGTPNQKGTCRVWFYATAGTDSNDETSVEIEAGKQLLFTLSGGNPAQGIAPVGTFTGYAIARCNFQYAHGYAFISDIGADDLAQGYVALVLDENIFRNGGSRPGTKSETLNN